jgi:type IV pilus assembly protein PilY1
VNDVISITGSAGYDGSNYSITNVTGSTVQFKMQGSPSPYDGGATVWVGTNSNSNNSATTGSAGSYASSSATGLIRGTNCSTCSSAAIGQVLMINIPGGTTNGFSLGNTVKISGSTNYNSTTGYPIIGLGSSCKVDVTTAPGTASSSDTVTTYQGTASVTTTSPPKTTTYTICLDLGSSFAYSPSLTSNGATSGVTTASRAGAGTAKTVSSMVRVASTCPTSNLGTTTVTIPSHGFASGSIVTIGRSDGGPNEGYNGTYTISGVTTDTFTIQVPTTPACSDTKGTISYQSSASGGVSATTLINWVRGQDSVGDEPSPPVPASPALPITIRGSVHGDVLHSRPAVINYGSSYGVVVFYGANDGVFRAVNGNQPAPATQPSTVPASAAPVYSPLGNCALGSACSITSAGVSVPPGGELWGFVPQEFYPKLQRLYLNSPDVLLATTSTAIVPTPTPKDYFFDGPTATYQTFDTNGNTTGAYIFLTARRGGRVLYAFDVTNPTAPKLLWKHTNADAGFAELGQTWSQPKVALLRGYVDTTKPTPYPSKPVLIFGAGYDGNNYDATTNTTYLGHDDMDPPGTAAMGRGIFIIDAMSGALIWSSTPSGAGCPGTATCLATAGMTSSIAADVTLVDTNFDGYDDRLYAADTGGNIWRVDLEKTPGTATAPYPPSSWQVTQLASLGGTVTTAAPRKFLFAPDVVLTKNFTAVLAGTGDREHPLLVQTATYNTVNRFYMVLDTITGVDSSAWTTVVDASDSKGSNAPPQATLFDASTTAFNISTSTCSGTGGCKGYYLLLNQNAQSTASGASTKGEQVVNAATTIGGYTYFGTNQPKPADPNSCSANLGNARAYKVGFLTGSGGFTNLDGGGLPPSPVAGLVEVPVNGTMTTVPFLLGGGGGAISGTIGGGTLTTCSGPDCKSSLGGQKPPIPIPVKKKRTYWYRQIDQ